MKVLDVFEKLVQKIEISPKNGAFKLISDLELGAIPFLASTIINKNHSRIFCITHTAQLATDLYNLNKFVLHINHVQGNEHDTTNPIQLYNYDQTNQNRALTKNIINLNNDPAIIYTDIDGYLELLQNTSTSKNLKLAAKDQISMHALSTWLGENKYEYDSYISNPGTYRKVGGRIDINIGVNKKYIQIELIGDAIESIYEFDTHSNNRKVLSEQIIIPSILQQSYDKQSDNLHIIVGIHFFIGEHALIKLRELNPELVSALKSTGDVLLSEQFLSDALLKHEVDLYKNEYKAFTSPLAVIKNTEHLIKIAEKTKQEHGMLLADGQNSLLIKQLKNKVDFFTPQGLRTKLKGFQIHQQSSRLVFITQESLDTKLQTKKTPASSKKEHRAFIASLKPNDYVVHRDHGIGKFIKTDIQIIDQTQREYFVIEYAGSDKIFVPVENAEKINRYIGSPNPKLHGLAQSNWHQIVRKATEDAQKIARELLELYAKREAAQGYQFLPFPREEDQLAESFEFQETPDQKDAIEEILADMEGQRPMDRLLCGDVGFGKTEVAIRAAFRAAMNKKQVAILCPTTILAQQHLDTFKRRLDQFGISIDMLSRFRSKTEQTKIVKNIKEGKIDIIIGTHRLLSADVTYNDLGFVIIDEEQRFGVMHKEKLKSLRTNVDILTLTATPIPRTLNLALSGTRDITTIETPPEGRLPIETIIQSYDKKIVQQEIRRSLQEQDQIYLLYNRVETIESYKHELEELVPEARITIAHGQMDEKNLASAIHEFDQGNSDILLCTTIIENGIDLPNANTLIVHNAPLFGLSQLYQLRGRIGRGKKQARAFLFYNSQQLPEKAKERLKALLQIKSLGGGFEIATKDLELRGAGSILGKEQSGRVAEIGLQLYSELLQQSIETQEHPTSAPKSRLDSIVELPFTTMIPPSLVSNEELRYEMYQKLASARSAQELTATVERLCYNLQIKQDQMPQEFKNLLEILEIKILAAKARISKVKTVPVYGIVGNNKANKYRILLEFAEKKSPEKLLALMKQNNYWRISDNNAKIDSENLGEHTLQEIKEAIAVLI